MRFDIHTWDRAECSEEERRRLLPLVDLAVQLSDTARRDGLLVLDDGIGVIEDVFLRTGLRLVVDGTDPDTIADLLTNMLHADQVRGADLLARMVAIVAVLGVQAGDNPYLLRLKLSAMLGSSFMDVPVGSDGETASVEEFVRAFGTAGTEIG